MCDQCEIVYINGVKCHEIGCPDAWKDETRECKWCGYEFKPEEKNQDFCEVSCAKSYSS